MTLTVGRMKDGDLLLAGEVDERQPPVLSGLIAHYPLDGSSQTASLWKSGFSGKLVADSSVHDLSASSYPLQPGQTLRFTGWFKKTSDWNGSFHYFAYQQYTPSGGTATWSWNSANFNTSFPADTWTYCEGTFTLGYQGDTITNQSQGVSIRNDATTGTLWWENCHCYVVNTTGAESNVTYLNGTYSDDGVFVEPASTNLIGTVSNADTYFDTASGWTLLNDTNYTSAIEYFPGAIYGKGNVLRVTDNDGNTSTSEWGGIAAASTTGLTNQAYTMSIRYRVVGWTTGSIAVWSHQQDSTGVNADMSDDYALPSSTFDGEWHVYSSTKTQTSGRDKRTWAIGMDKTNLGATIYVDAIQFEALAFNTSFTKGSRAVGKLYLPFSLAQATNFTINAFVKYNRSDNTIDIFCDDTNRWNGQLRVTGNELELLLRDTSAATHNQYTAALSPAPSDGNWHMYTIVSDTSYGGVKLYYDGNNVASWSGLYPCYTSLSVGRNGMGDSSVMGGYYRDFSIYNRALSAAEVMKLHRRTFSVTKDGNVRSNVIEQSNDIPAEVTYIPFGLNAKDDALSISPSTESNTVYQNGAMWIGEGTTNLYTGEYGGTGGVTINGAWYQKTTTGNFRAYVTLTSLTNGTTYSCSADIYNPTDTAIVVECDWCDVTAVNFTIAPGDTQTVSITQSRATYDSTYRFWDINLTTGTEYWIRNIQIEALTFSTPYVGSQGGTRGAGLLKYPLTFTPNMSFSFWHKLSNDLASITTQGTSPNLFEVGDYYANSSFTLWYWGGNNLRVYARQDGATGWTIGGANLTGTFDQNYWNQWHNYTIVFTGSGTTITGVTVYIDGVSCYSNTSLTITSWSGSFFGMGSYNGMQPNAYYRDLIYTPTAISGTTAFNIYKNQMRAYKDNRLQVRGQIIEGQVL